MFFFNKNSHSAISKSNAFRPRLEGLEDREVPSVAFSGQTFNTGTTPMDVAVADFNGDGRPDTVSANFGSNDVSVFLNTTPAGAGTASFAAAKNFAFAVLSNPAAVTVGDVNGDGKPDIIVALSGSNSVGVLLNTTPTGASTASFAAPQIFAAGTAPNSVVIGDFNRDGKDDIAVANFGSQSVQVLTNTTMTGSNTLSFTMFTDFLGTKVTTVAVGDINGDRRSDLVVGNQDTNTVAVLLNTTPNGANASFAAAQNIFVGTADYEAALKDLNGDGKVDLVVGSNSTKSIAMLLNTTASAAGSASFDLVQSFAVGSDPFSLTFGDFNGDGRIDIATANEASSNASVLLNTTTPGTGSLTFAAQQTFPIDPTSYGIKTGDFNSDGKTDLITSSATNGSLTVLLNKTQPTIVANLTGAGVWSFDPAQNSWVQLSAANAQKLAADADGDVVASFQGAGVWEFNPSSGWKQLTVTDASALTIGTTGDIAAAFQGAGVWEIHPGGGWAQIATGNATSLAMNLNGYIAGAFTGAGVWEYKPATGWTQLGAVDAKSVAIDDSGEIVGAFQSAGLWEYKPATGWAQLSAANVVSAAMNGKGDVAASFQGGGVWDYNSAAGWQKLSAPDAASVSIDRFGEVFGAFANAGVWEYDPFAGWKQANNKDASVLAAV